MTRSEERKKRHGDMEGPALVSWDVEASEQDEVFREYAKAIEHSSHSVANYRRDFRGLDTNIDGRPGLTNLDFDWFRPNQAAPRKPKEIMLFARHAYRRIGIIHNAIDLMGDFSCQGIRLVHPNKRIEKFYNEWFDQVKGKIVSERIGHLSFREANGVIRYFTAKINKGKRLKMQKAIGAEDVKFNQDDIKTMRNEIPWKYTFLDPILVEPIGGSLCNLSNQKILALKVPNNVKVEINKLIHDQSPAAKDALSKISPDIIKAVNTGRDIVLPSDKTYMFHYKKDDWQTWADPMVYSAFEPLNLYQRLQLADKAALDGATSKIRVWKIGSLEHKLAPTAAASATLGDMLGANVGGGTIDIVWGPDIELIESSTDVQSFLGEEKYRPTLMAIYASLGIPPTLTGTFGASGTTNNFIALKTLVERLNYVRGTIIDFWNQQIALVQQSMGFKQPATVEFDIMYLEDPAAMTTLLLSMVDRNILSDEFIQRHVKAKPAIEDRRMSKEAKLRESKDVEKISPYHQVDQDHALKKIALQTGQSAPSEVGLELEEKKDGEKTIMESREQEAKNKMAAAPNKSGPGSPGRPQNSKDKVARKPKTFKPKSKASIEMWARQAQEEISAILNPVLLKSFNKASIRNLTSKELESVERIKFEVLCNLSMGDDVSANIKAACTSTTLPKETIHRSFSDWRKSAEEFMGKLNIDQIRGLRAAYYVDFKYGDIK